MTELLSVTSSSLSSTPTMISSSDNSAVGPALAIADHVSVYAADGPLLNDVSLSVYPGQIHALMGPSGSGKTTLARAFLGEIGANLELSGKLTVAGYHVGADLPSGLIGYIPQNPARFLNPVRRIGSVLTEIHKAAIRRKTDKNQLTIDQALEKVVLPGLEVIGRRYPHQLSGGQQQRLIFAQMLIAGSRFIIADEPTASQDTLSRSAIAELLKELASMGIAILLLTHDQVLATISDRTTFLHAGAVSPVLESNRHSNFDHNSESKMLDTAGTTASAILTITGLSATHRGAKQPCLDQIELRLAHGEKLAVIGPSGSGKTTLIRAIAGTFTHYQGRISWQEKLVPPHCCDRPRSLLADIQYVYQEPRSAFIADRSVLRQLTRAVTRLLGCSQSQATDRAVSALDKVGIGLDIAERQAWSLSGGQLQRCGLARALAVNPGLYLCDEITSALDTASQQEVLQALATCTANSTLIMVTHDLAVAEQICTRAVVLADGHIVEDLPMKNFRAHAAHPVTQDLIAHCSATDVDTRRDQIRTMSHLIAQR